MTDRPVIFSKPMVLALLREVARPGTGKTMTRRYAHTSRKAKLQPNPATVWDVRPSTWQRVQPGDRLWVRENLIQRPVVNFLTGEQCPGDIREAAYAADGEDVVNEHEFNLCPWWKGDGGLPSIHMPRSVSRLTLVVTATRLERLQRITDEDAVREGIQYVRRSLTRHGRMDGYGVDESAPEDASPTARQAFCRLWETLHGPASWDGDPELVVTTFQVHLKNIDDMPERACAPSVAVAT